MAETLTDSLVRRLTPLFEESLNKLTEAGISKFDEYLDSLAFELPEVSMRKFDLLVDSIGEVGTSVDEIRKGEKSEKEIVDEITANIEEYQLNEVLPRLEVVSDMVERQHSAPETVSKTSVEGNGVTNVTYVVNNYNNSETSNSEVSIEEHPSHEEQSKEKITSEVERQEKEFFTQDNTTSLVDKDGSTDTEHFTEKEHDTESSTKENFTEEVTVESAVSSNGTLEVKASGSKGSVVDLHLSVSDISREKEEKQEDSSEETQPQESTESTEQETTSEEKQSESVTEQEIDVLPPSEESTDSKELEEKESETVVDSLTSEEVSKEDNTVTVIYSGEGRVVDVMGLRLQMPDISREKEEKQEDSSEETQPQESTESTEQETTSEDAVQQVTELDDILSVLESHSEQLVTISSLFAGKETKDESRNVDLKRFVKTTVKENSSTTWNKIKNFLKTALLVGGIFLFRDAIGKIIQKFWTDTIKPVISKAGDWLKVNAPDTYNKIESIISTVRQTFVELGSIRNAVIAIYNWMADALGSDKHLITDAERGALSRDEYSKLLVDGKWSSREYDSTVLGNDALGYYGVSNGAVIDSLVQTETVARTRDAQQPGVDYTGKGVDFHITPEEYVHSYYHAGQESRTISGEKFYNNGKQWFNEDFTKVYDPESKKVYNNEVASQNAGYAEMLLQAKEKYDAAANAPMSAYESALGYYDADTWKSLSYKDGDYTVENTDYHIENGTVYKLVPGKAGTYSPELGGTPSEQRMYNGRVKIEVPDRDLPSPGNGLPQNSMAEGFVIPEYFNESSVTPTSEVANATIEPVEPESGNPVNVTTPTFGTSEIPKLITPLDEGSNLDTLGGSELNSFGNSQVVNNSANTNAMFLDNSSRTESSKKQVVNNINHYTTTVINKIVPNGRSLTD